MKYYASFKLFKIHFKTLIIYNYFFAIQYIMHAVKKLMIKKVIKITIY